MDENLPVPRQSQEIVPSQHQVDPTQSGGSIWTSFDPNAEDNKPLILKAFNAPDIATDQLKGQEFLLSNGLCHRVDIQDAKTGEIVTTTRTVLFNPDHLTCAFVSQGIWSSLRNIILVYGPPPWEPPIRVRLRESITRSKFRLYTLDVLGKAIPLQPQSKKK